MDFTQRLIEYQELLKNIKLKQEEVEDKKFNFLKNITLSSKKKSAMGVKSFYFERDVIKPLLKEIEEMTFAVHTMEITHFTKVKLGDLIEELKNIMNLKNKEIIVDISDIKFAFKKPATRDDIIHYVENKQFNPDFVLYLYHKMYEQPNTPNNFFYMKHIPFNTSLRFDKGSLKENITTQGFPVDIRFKDINSMYVKFGLKELISENEAWMPIEPLRTAVINCTKKELEKELKKY